MNRRAFMGAAGTLAVGLGLGGPAFAAGQIGQATPLPTPTGLAGKTLEEALRARRSQRAYADKDLPDDILSGLLWAAWGVNRPSGKRTAPSAINKQEIDIYVAKRDGLFLYDAKNHELIRKGNEDLRAISGKQSFVGTAPVNLVFVADMDKAADEEHDKRFLVAADTGFISQNVYLYCAVMGLATVVRVNTNPEVLSKAMGLADNQLITMAQCVGYPKA